MDAKHRQISKTLESDDTRYDPYERCSYCRKTWTLAGSVCRFCRGKERDS